MKKIIAKINFKLNDTNYIIGDEIKTDNINMIKKLNEKGLIEPLSYEDLVLIERELKENKNKL